MNFKKLFLPSGLILAIAAALLVAVPQGAIEVLSPLKGWLVIIIFLINGYQTRLRDAPRSPRFVGAFVFAAMLTLIGAPWLGRGVGDLLGMSSVMALGLIVMSSVPSTLSSGIVLTDVAGGNTLWALILTIGLNVLGVFTVPFMLAWCLQATDVEVSSSKLLIKLALWVLAPFLIGGFSRRLLGDRQLIPALKYIPSTCVILTVWISCIAQRGQLLSLRPATLALIAAAAMTIHLLLMLACLGASFPLRLKPDERRALMFLGSQKTLPVALGVLAALGTNVGAGVIVCIVFHFLQLITDSFIASKMAAAKKVTS